jgi:hypothetical protein
MNQPTEPTRVVTIKETRLTLPDLLDDLLWPKLFRTAALGLHPARIAIAFLTLALVGAIGSLSALWTSADAGTPPFNARLRALWTDLVAHESGSPLLALLALPQSLLRFLQASWLETLLLGLPMLAILSLGMGAIARMTACEFSAGVSLSTSQSLAYTLRRWPSFLGAVFAPLLFIAILMLLLAISGWALLQLPALDVLGALLYPLAIAISALALLAIVGYLFGFPLLVPAVACEGTDAIDAFQRMYAYVVGRPGRLALNMLLLIALLWIIGTLISILMGATLLLATSTLSAWTDQSAALVAAGTPGLEGSRAIASRIIQTWHALVSVVAAAAIFSCFASGSTILYLIMRQHCDGQDWGELWFPGADEATLQDAAIASPSAPLAGSAARASARALRSATRQTTDTPPPPTPPTEPDSQSTPPRPADPT